VVPTFPSGLGFRPLWAFYDHGADENLWFRRDRGCTVSVDDVRVVVDGVLVE
jgi:hypothetical protein